MIRVLIVDDHELLRAGLRSRLENESGIAVVGEADTAERAVLMARRLQPDLILLDLLLPRKSGYDAIPELAKAAPQAKVLVFSSQAAPSSLRRALSAGAAGYLPKRSSDRELVTAIRLVADGGGYVDPDLGAKLVNPNASPALEPSRNESATSSICWRSATRIRRSARSSLSQCGRSIRIARTSCASCNSTHEPSW